MRKVSRNQPNRSAKQSMRTRVETNSFLHESFAYDNIMRKTTLQSDKWECDPERLIFICKLSSTTLEEDDPLHKVKVSGVLGFSV